MPLGTLVSPSPILEDNIMLFHPLAGFALGCLFLAAPPAASQSSPGG